MIVRSYQRFIHFLLVFEIVFGGGEGVEGAFLEVESLRHIFSECDDNIIRSGVGVVDGVVFFFVLERECFNEFISRVRRSRIAGIENSAHLPNCLLYTSY